MKLLFSKINSQDATVRSGFFNLCFKSLSSILSLVYTPMLLLYLGKEKYGLWVTLLTIISWVNYFDVGIWQGLRNVLTRHITEGDLAEAKKAISTAYIVLSIISCAILLLLSILLVLTDWNHVFSTQIDMKMTIGISFVFICINFILALSNTILYALQLAERVSLRSCIVQIINIVGIVILRSFSSENMVAVAVLFGSSTMIVYVANTLQLFRLRPYLAPKINGFDRSKIKLICNVGVKFFIIQIMGLFLFTADNLLITHYFGSDAVTTYSIVNKVFNTAYSFFFAFLVPYWSRTTMAITKHDTNWMRTNIKRVFLFCALFCAGYFVILMVFKPLVAIWLNRSLEYAPGLILLMCVFYCVYSVFAVECQFINGTGAINVQLILYIIIGIVNIPFAIFLSVYLKMGVVGVRLATTILITIAVVILGINLSGIIKNIEKEHNILVAGGEDVTF